MSAAITAETVRLAAVLDHASLGIFTGMFTDNEALERAEQLGLVRRNFEGAAAFFGLSKLYLTDAGRALLDEQP